MPNPSFQRRAEQIGPHTARLITTIFDRAQIPVQFFRRCQGILGLARTFSPTVLEQAAQRALQAESFAVRAAHAYCEAVQPQRHLAPRCPPRKTSADRWITLRYRRCHRRPEV